MHEIRKNNNKLINNNNNNNNFLAMHTQKKLAVA
jgi:hypothetical protein